jgi:hypothetical protein
MIVISQFAAQIPEAVGDGKVLQAFFLHHLFPNNYPWSNAVTERAALQPLRSYKLVAADGFARTVTHGTAFEKGMDWLCAISLPEDLFYNGLALLGIAIGLRKGSTAKWEAWWRDLVMPHLRTKEAETGLARMLAAISGMGELSFTPTDFPEYVLAAGLLSQPPIWDAKPLEKYLLTTRKLSFPYYDDFLLCMLAVFIQDQAIANALLSSADIATVERNAVTQQWSSIEANLATAADWRARVVVTTAAIGALVVIVASCGAMFSWHGQTMAHRATWDELKWIALWIGGPIPGVTVLLRILFFALRRRPLDLDLQTLHRAYKLRLLRRWRRKLLTPSAPNHLAAN